eukprot:CAMPEP_0168610302 /NCGR_PEP_ID=MMETSP0449_2-20121227/1709_1 /TAXON_ID=1082188 /ORGANISM="Strombidium rassoulzadegani, Strain ras09" /LENGTH=76 /DNA_ID=CAMNT_0008650587 /DNA_START=64 /DNA_END=294 /DNA_ORIENTATION=+
MAKVYHPDNKASGSKMNFQSLQEAYQLVYDHLDSSPNAQSSTGDRDGGTNDEPLMPEDLEELLRKYKQRAEFEEYF